MFGREKEWPTHLNRCVVCWCCIHGYGNTVDSLRLKQFGHTFSLGFAQPRTPHVSPAAAGFVWCVRSGWHAAEGSVGCGISACLWLEYDQEAIIGLQTSAYPFACGVREEREAIIGLRASAGSFALGFGKDGRKRA